MELNQIRYFLALAETLNFTHAAKKCGVSQPTLSRGIQKLEEELGAPLIRRERSNTHLTALGARVRPRLEQSLALAEAAKSEAQSFADRAQGVLHFGVMRTIGPNRLIALIDHITRTMPDVELRLFEGAADEVAERLLKGEFDVALLGMPSYPDELHLEPLYEERFVIAFAAGHRFSGMNVVPRSELRGERYLQRINCDYPAHVRALIGPYEAEVDVRYSTVHEDWIQAMIIAGLGCACMPEFSPMFPEIQTRLLIEPEVARTISLATVRGRPHTASVRLFQKMCRAALKREQKVAEITAM